MTNGLGLACPDPGSRAVDSAFHDDSHCVLNLESVFVFASKHMPQYLVTHERLLMKVPLVSVQVAASCRERVRLTIGQSTISWRLATNKPCRSSA